MLVHLPGRAERPSCRSRHAVTRFRSPVKVRVVCRGSALEPLRVARGPFSGHFGSVRRSGGGARRTLTMRVRPGRSFVGQDLALVRARGRGGSDIEAVAVSTLPWRFRALGDSVTAGFGYYGTGAPMSAAELPFCKPATVVSNRCSSNSDKGPGDTGPPEWSADFGLANDISWAAQFANDLRGRRDRARHVPESGGHRLGAERLASGRDPQPAAERDRRRGPGADRVHHGRQPAAHGRPAQRCRRVLRVHGLRAGAGGLHPAVLHAGAARVTAAELLHRAARGARTASSRLSNTT